MTTLCGEPARPVWRVAMIFLASLFLLQFAWNELRSSPLERWVIDQCTVRVNAALINALTSHPQAVAVGSRIVAPGRGINVRRGCEGTEILFPLVAGLIWSEFLQTGGSAALAIACGCLVGHLSDKRSRPRLPAADAAAG